MSLELYLKISTRLRALCNKHELDYNTTKSYPNIADANDIIAHRKLNEAHQHLAKMEAIQSAMDAVLDEFDRAPADNADAVRGPRQTPNFSAVVCLEDMPQILKQGCMVPNCGHKHDELFMTQRCHPKAGLDVAIFKGSDKVMLTCRECKRFIVSFKVGARESTATVVE